MIEIKLPQVTSSLEILSVATERKRDAAERLEAAQKPYERLIAILNDALLNDPTIMELRDELNEASELLNKARSEVDQAAIQAFECDLTLGWKEWSDGNWEIRLREYRKPSVEDVGAFVDHVSQLGASSIIKSITLNKKDACDMFEKIDDGIAGMSVEKELQASARLKLSL